jgi:solute carrier family 25 (mitochondrial carnitine/acylcarnitine transporter), member 20/29
VTSIRDAVGYGFYFWSYEICRRVLKTSEEDEARVAAAKVLLAGGIAGVVTWASIFPLDVIKTRVQTQAFTSLPSPVVSPPPSPMPSVTSRLLNPSGDAVGESVKVPSFARRGAIEMARNIYTTEGIAPFFRGLGICSVRAFIVNAVQWAVYEWMMRVLKGSSASSAPLKTNAVSV